MDVMGKYCKAYPIASFRQYGGWREQVESVRDKSDLGEDGRFKDDAFLFLQENLVVTDGVIKNAHIVFDAVTPEWRRFCEDVLAFPKESIVEETDAVAGV